MVSKFPLNAASARGVKESDWKKNLLVPHKEEDGQIYVPIPKNIGDHSDNLLMITILKIVQEKEWKTIPSDIEVPLAVLKSEKNMFFAGYVAKSYDDEIGPRIKASNQYERGMLSAQTDAVLHHIGKRNGHIRRTDHTFGKVLAEMRGFTNQYWGLRGAISRLFHDLPKPKISKEHSHTFMLSGGELIGKIVRKTLPYSNGGIFRKEELAYFNSMWAKTNEQLMEIHKLCNRPTSVFANEFWERMDLLSDKVKEIEKQTGTVYAQRAKYLFRTGSKKKVDIKWTKMSLDDKLSETSPDELRRLFSPLDLPGFPKTAGTIGENSLDDQYLADKYRIRDDDPYCHEKLALSATYEDLLAASISEAAT